MALHEMNVRKRFLKEIIYTTNQKQSRQMLSAEAASGGITPTKLQSKIALMVKDY
jgi:hypothetical protein